MTRKFLSLMLGLALLALPTVTQAALTDNLDATGLINKIKFTNYEVFVRGTVDDYTYLDADADLEDGDHLVTVFSASELTIQNAPGSGVFGPEPAWQKGNGNGYFLGYSVAKIALTAGGLSYDTPDFDPNGLLLTGEMVALYNSTEDWSIVGANIETDVDNSFDVADKWAGFGIVSDTNGGGFTALPPIFGTLLGVTAIGLDAINGPEDWPGFDKSKAFGNDIFAGANIYTPGQNAWTYRSEDPLTFAAVPEPGTLALWGGCLAIGAVLALRRRKN
ncbi:MAG: PEP-CTERM sorting domain-containing protein [Pirellulaceae bacterium]